MGSGHGTGVGGSHNSGAANNQSIRVGDHKNNKQYKSIVSFDTAELPAAVRVDGGARGVGSVRK